jgi:hypothetical protein
MTTVVMMQAQPVALDAKSIQTVDTVNPAYHAIIYNSRLSANAKYLACMPGAIGIGPAFAAGLGQGSCVCNILRWEGLSARSFVRVYENAIYTNHATTTSFGCGVADNHNLVYFDRTPESWSTASICTPYHCCGCIECAGQVVGVAPMAICNNPCCPLRGFIGGLENSADFVAAVVKAREVFRQGARLPPGCMLPQPMMVQMS